MILQGDCLEQMKKLDDNSVDSIVSDPPYALNFMNKKWDAEVPSVAIWQEALRVLKPGGHLLAFGGTRTYHRLVVNIEDAGFEIRDQIQWLYGSGFPKSTDVSKRIDKEAGAKGESYIDESFLKRNPKDNSDGVLESGLKDGISGAIRFKPSTDQAKQYQGWGTALKPANEPICVARKPLEKGLTVAQNVLKYGTGGINIDESRIGTETIHTGRWPANIILDEAAAEALNTQAENVSRFFQVIKNENCDKESECNPLYVNIVIMNLKTILAINGLTVHSNAAVKPEEKLVQNVKSAGNLSDSCATLIAQHIVEVTSLDFKSQALQAYLDSIQDFKNYILSQSLVLIAKRWASTGIIPTTQSLSKLFGYARLATDESINLENQRNNNAPTRFLYQAKASKSERNKGLEGMPLKESGIKNDSGRGFSESDPHKKILNQNHHPTVKPIKLMEYLIRLVTPKGGTTLDPFMGSGSTGVAAKNLGFNFIGIELNPEYVEIAEKRIESA